tara:strand:+ start:1482 stop:1916 length:435 start_codon:yes stop_codon:yes gene_type:complete
MNLLREYIKEVAAPSSNKGGDCFEAAGKYMMEKCQIEGCDIVLVHGEVAGQGPLRGIRYGHAWVEDSGTVIDRSNGRNLQLPKTIYYSLGQIASADMSKWGKPEFGQDVFSGGNLHKYTWEEARKKILDSGHWGPWDLVTESGL